MPLHAKPTLWSGPKPRAEHRERTPVSPDVHASSTIPHARRGVPSRTRSSAASSHARWEQRVSRLNAHILPTIGDVPVTKWRVEHSRMVMEKGGKTLFPRPRGPPRPAVRERKLAWRLGWLDRSIDPLDGLSIGRANILHGATTQYVDPRFARRRGRCARWRLALTCCVVPTGPIR